MGLDKWLKPEDTGKNSKKKRISQEIIKESKDNQIKKKNAEDISRKLMKYTLLCQNKKCKYQKTIVKKLLTEEDKKCPRCEKEMKIKEE
jgi:hypothetical protein